MRLKSAITSCLPKSAYALWRDLRMKTTFEKIYSANVWGDRETRSGHASNSLHSRVIRTELPKLLREFSLTSMLDIPCGDFFWMRQVEMGAVKYLGADIVLDLIKANQKQYGSK